MPPNLPLSRLFRPSVCSSCRQSMRRSQHVSLSSSAVRFAEGNGSTSRTTSKQDPSSDAKPADDNSELFASLRDLVIDVPSDPRKKNARKSTDGLLSNITLAQQDAPMKKLSAGISPRQEPHHMHIYAHKHNTHIVLTRPNREPILSYSTGNIGFRKAQRGSFDAAFQLAAYVMRTISDKGLLRHARDSQFAEANVGTRQIESPIRNLELVLRGFGKGREAVVKALLGTEGKALREKVTMVSDDTKLKFGGTRSPNPRRLG